mmetsp:Transcript_45701/g.108821  ORF Transcript_45701/g.108821 Transcript_45701/m.108821 type:complete len:221 (-) Transcript_45701:483-1145(-)
MSIQSWAAAEVKKLSSMLRCLNLQFLRKTSLKPSAHSSLSTLPATSKCVSIMLLKSETQIRFMPSSRMRLLRSSSLWIGRFCCSSVDKALAPMLEMLFPLKSSRDMESPPSRRPSTSNFTPASPSKFKPKCSSVNRGFSLMALARCWAPTSPMLLSFSTSTSMVLASANQGARSSIPLSPMLLELSTRSARPTCCFKATASRPKLLSCSSLLRRSSVRMP